METESYLDLPNCYRLTNGAVDLVVATDVGPRILRYGFVGEANMLGEAPGAAKATELGDWKPWGGHRLWAAPESVPRTYHPDNDPVAFSGEGRTAWLMGAVERTTGLRKEVIVTLGESGTDVLVAHRITNLGLWPVELAPWAITIMAGGGTAVVPHEPYAPHGDERLLPVRNMALWSYSDLGDPRFSFGRKYTLVRCDPRAEAAVKVGISNTLGWLAYAREGTLFVKHFPYESGAVYPDRGCNAEIFTQGDYLELESLAALTRLESGGTVGHVERWSLHHTGDVGATDESVDRAIGPALAPGDA